MNDRTIRLTQRNRAMRKAGRCTIGRPHHRCNRTHSRHGARRPKSKA